tara:strand:- start:1260 stop:1430 length:171 start_codon:yes stop_codon:yes gene_type:complete
MALSNKKEATKKKKMIMYIMYIKLIIESGKKKNVYVSYVTISSLWVYGCKRNKIYK